MAAVLGDPRAINDKVVTVMRGVSKIFVGDIVETARQVAASQGHQGALLPGHIHCAYQLLDQQGRIPHRQKRGRLFKP